MMIKYFLLWFPMLFLAILNGTARDLWYVNYLGELAARQLSTLTLLLLFTLYFLVLFKYSLTVSNSEALFIGVFWVILTLVFEFGFGLYRGNSWAVLVQEYNIAKGKLWILIPIWVSIGPYCINRLLNN
ncbi:membrane protein [Flavobacterium cauense R2A-7]|nr:membrane protein [Flavobacterium cauense R2A-7]